MSSRLAAHRLNAFVRQRVAGPHKLAVRHAGHSHWQNIRHVKGVNDSIKGDKSQQLALMVKQALTEPGGTDLKTNSSLAKAVKFGEKNSIPAKSIQSVISKAWESQQKRQLQTIEGRGPAGSFLIFKVSTDQVKRTQVLVNRCLAKCGGAVLSTGATTNHFTKKGIILVTPADSKPLSLEEAEEIAISVDAEEVEQIDITGSEPKLFQLTCDPNLLNSVVEKLSETGLEVEECRVEPVPVARVELNPAEKSNLESAVNFIRTHNEISLESVYDNVKWQ